MGVRVGRWSGIARLVCAIAMVLATAGIARADKVDTLVQRVLSGSTARKRVAAVVMLARTGDARAVPACVSALDDPEARVRVAAAAALGKIVDASTDAAARDAAVKKLTLVARTDKRARRAANQALTQMLAGTKGSPVFLSIEKATGGAGSSESLERVATRTVHKTFSQAGSGFAFKAGGTRKPTARRLAKNKMAGYRVEATIDTVTATRTKIGMSVSCAVSVRLSGYPKGGLVSVTRASARVRAGPGADATSAAKQDCVGAVTEQAVQQVIAQVAPASAATGSGAPAAGGVVVGESVSGPKDSSSELSCEGKQEAEECLATGLAKLGADDQRASRLLEEACGAGQPLGCVALATALRADTPAVSSKRTAVELLDGACDDGEASACWKLGRLYLRGDSVEQDLAAARRLFQRACTLGSQAGCDFVDGIPTP